MIWNIIGAAICGIYSLYALIIATTIAIKHGWSDKYGHYFEQDRKIIAMFASIALILAAAAIFFAKGIR